MSVKRIIAKHKSHPPTRAQVNSMYKTRARIMNAKMAISESHTGVKIFASAYVLGNPEEIEEYKAKIKAINK